MSLNSLNKEEYILISGKHNRYIKIDEISYFRITEHTTDIELSIYFKGNNKLLNFYIEKSKIKELQNYLNERLEVKKF